MLHYIKQCFYKTLIIIVFLIVIGLYVWLLFSAGYFLGYMFTSLFSSSVFGFQFGDEIPFLLGFLFVISGLFSVR